MTASRSAPLRVPIAEPRPPDRLAPPMMTAAKTGNVSETPAFGCVEPMNEKSRIAAVAASIEHVMNAANLYLRIGSRASSAASGLPPMALSRKPNSERASTNPTTIAMPIIQRPCIGMSNGRSWFDRPKNQSISPGGTGLPPVGYAGLRFAVFDVSRVIPKMS